MKKLFIIVLALIFSLTFSGCKQEDEVKSVGFATLGSEGFFGLLANGLETAFTDAGWEWNIGVANFNPIVQIEQIENMITLGVDVLVVMPVDPTALGDVLADAKAAGIKVIDFTASTGQGDILIGSDDVLIGERVAELASDWINIAYADATAGSVNVAVFESRATPEAVQRALGLATIANNSKVNVVTTIEVENTRAAAQAAAENLLLTNPEIDVIITHNTTMGLGVNDYVVSPSSPITDLSMFGVFGSDNDPEVLAAVQASANNTSVLRGATQLGGTLEELFAIVLGYATDLYEGNEVPAEDLAEVFKITPANAADYIQ